MKTVAPLVIMLLCIFSCKHKDAIPSSLSEVRNIVDSIDVAVSQLYGWEPRDSTYNHTIDTIVANAINSTDISGVISQSVYDDSRETWTEFKRLCDAEKYEEALDYYFGEDSSGSKRGGDFLVFLKHSSNRYAFLSKVLLPLMEEYKGHEFAMNEYVDLLELEKDLEGIVSMNRKKDGDIYMPEVWPAVVTDLGNALLETGRTEEAFDLFPELTKYVLALTEDAMLANYFGTKYVSNLYLRIGSPEEAKNVWMGLKEYLQEHSDDYDLEQLDWGYDAIQEELKRIE